MFHYQSLIHSVTFGKSRRAAGSLFYPIQVSGELNRKSAGSVAEVTTVDAITLLPRLDLLA